ncbi:MAG: hypothetical protein EHM67_14720, partial [Hyphomicrobiaceae bacterium]
MRQLIGTAAEWAANDLVIGSGELAVEPLEAGDHDVKVGDGVKRYSELPYLRLGMASTTEAERGAGGVGFNPDLVYPPNTVGGNMTGAAGSKIRANFILAGNGHFNANPAWQDPGHLFEIVNDNSPNQCFSMSAYGQLTNGNNMHFNRYWGAEAAPAAVPSAAYFKSEGYRGWDGSGVLSQSMAAHQVFSSEAWSPTAHGIKFHWEVTPAGSSNRQQAMELFAGPTDACILQLGNASSFLSRILAGGETAGLQVHGSGSQGGAQSVWFGTQHATAPMERLNRANRTKWELVDGTERMRLTTSGLGVNTGADSGYAFQVKSVSANVFNLTANTGAAMVYSTTGASFYDAGENAAAAALVFRKHSTTGRSINAAGTVNASGADYAEYMRKAPACGTVAPGQIVGIDASGEITDAWAGAISFAVKSTNPSYVGGDTYGNEAAVGARPTEPVFEPPPYDGPDMPAQIPLPVDAADLEKLPALEAAHAAALAAFNAARSTYEADVAA